MLTFELVACLRVNFYKSFMICTNMGVGEAWFLASIVGHRLESLPFMYLALSLSNRNLGKLDW